jgi:alpha-amylase/alpha-mannosidase (GH57 family)
MHQPYYRAGRNAPFDMPWARMHALKDYFDMVDILATYPDLHQTFNLVPSLVEQLETYASGDFTDVYWEHTLKPAQDLEPAERAFVLERMCEHSDHPRTRAHPRYLELALKREAQAAQGWAACAAAFTVDELRDLQVWFNLAWFEPQILDQPPLVDLIRRGSRFAEEDKLVIAAVQQELLVKTLPAYRAASARGQIELSTSPYFHPILPLLINSDSARIASAEVPLPRRRFAHPQDAAEQVQRAIAKHKATFGTRPQGIWCSEQAVGEDVIPLLLRSGFEWTISDESVLARSLSGVSPLRSSGQSPLGGPAGSFSSDGKTIMPIDLHVPYRLERDGGSMAIVFRDHTLSDLIGFAYSSWDSRDAAADLIRRLRELRTVLASDRSSRRSSGGELPLVTIALDGENAWEYYPRDGHDFLQYLYEGLNADPGLRCVTVSEHLRDAPATRELGWLHTGSWISADLRTWIGDPAHSVAWELLHDARDTVSQAVAATADAHPAVVPSQEVLQALDEAWHHVLVAEGSDWFWWFGEHHHTSLDAVWDANFRRHLEEAYRLLRGNVPVDLFFPVITDGGSRVPIDPRGPVRPVIDGLIGFATEPDGTKPDAGSATDEWADAGTLAPVVASTMQRAETTIIHEVKYGWDGPRLCLLVVPDASSALEGLEIEVRFVRPRDGEDVTLLAVLGPGGSVRSECKLCPQLPLESWGAWNQVVELSLGLPPTREGDVSEEVGFVVRIGRDGMAEHVFHSARLGSQGWVSR